MPATLVAELGAAAFTKTALDGGRQMGLTGSEMLSVVRRDPIQGAIEMKRALCPRCGSREWEQFKGETFEISYRAFTATEKDLAGWRCRACDEVVFDKASAERYTAAGDKLVLAARTAERTEIRRIRRKLGLTQAMAAKITGGGHNAFSRYERGETAPVPAVMNLLRLLDRHPELLRELTEVPRER